jgi:hypothetical protein
MNSLDEIMIILLNNKSELQSLTNRHPLKLEHDSEIEEFQIEEFSEEWCIQAISDWKLLQEKKEDRKHKLKMKITGSILMIIAFALNICGILKVYNYKMEGLIIISIGIFMFAMSLLTRTDDIGELN